MAALGQAANSIEIRNATRFIDFSLDRSRAPVGYEGRIRAMSMQAKNDQSMTTEGEDEIVVLSVGVDIGSSTSHLVFSRIVLERLDSRYVVTERETFYASDILLTPYSAENTIDAEALGAFIKKEYEDA